MSNNNEKQLETHFRSIATGSQCVFAGPHDYCSTYFSILSTLRIKIYPAIDIGLRKDGAVYTLHNSDHFDEVVHKAGEILGISKAPPVNNDVNKDPLTPYEIFVLLLAIRIHDAGNCLGRDEHEKRCCDILHEVYPDFPFRDNELYAIADIAQAHGGRTPDGSKDVIGQLTEYEQIGNVRIRAQRIAAIVRMADELAENALRTPSYLLENGGIPKANEVFHQYAYSLTSNLVEVLEKGRKVYLTYSLSVEDARRKFGKHENEVFLIDEIRERLEKMNRERVYCNRFLLPDERIESILARIVIRQNNPKKIVYKSEFLIRDEGYPDDLALPQALVSEWNGAEILSKLDAES